MQKIRETIYFRRHSFFAGGQDVRFDGRFARDGQQPRGAIRGDRYVRYVSDLLWVLKIKPALLKFEGTKTFATVNVDLGEVR